MCFISFLIKALDGIAIFWKNLSVCELLKDGLSLCLASGEESCKLPLGEHGHATELLESQPYGFMNYFSIHILPVVVADLEPPFWRFVFQWPPTFIIRSAQHDA